MGGRGIREGEEASSSVSGRERSINMSKTENESERRESCSLLIALEAEIFPMNVKSLSAHVRCSECQSRVSDSPITGRGNDGGKLKSFFFSPQRFKLSIRT
jgi:hypothetical protein